MRIGPWKKTGMAGVTKRIIEDYPVERIRSLPQQPPDRKKMKRGALWTSLDLYGILLPLACVGPLDGVTCGEGIGRLMWAREHVATVDIIQFHGISATALAMELSTPVRQWTGLQTAQLVASDPTVLSKVRRPELRNYIMACANAVGWKWLCDYLRKKSGGLNHVKVATEIAEKVSNASRRFIRGTAVWSTRHHQTRRARIHLRYNLLQPPELLGFIRANKPLPQVKVPKNTFA